jgi:hypothetical protein
MRYTLSLLAIAAVLSFPAAAGIITIGPYSDSVGVTDTPRTDTLDLQYFDSNLGNLIQVEIVLEGSVEGIIDVTNSGTVNKTVSGNLSATLDLTAPDNVTPLLNLLVASPVGPIVIPAGTQQQIIAANVVGSNSLIITSATPALLAQFEQAGGGTMPLLVAVDSLAGVFISGGGTILADIDASSFASVKYTYETQDVVVPEPSVMFLSGAGLIGLALLGRKRYPGRQ